MHKTLRKFFSSGKKEKNTPFVLNAYFSADFVNKKVQMMKKKLPIISRYIPKMIAMHWELIFTSFVSGVLLMTAGIVTNDILSEYHKLRAIETERAQIAAKRSKWEEIAKHFPDYRDAYFQVALASYQLGDGKKARDTIQRVLRLDPQFAPAKALESKIGKI
jgi:tetratricopeptide (TPR) repeat protein